MKLNYDAAKDIMLFLEEFMVLDVKDIDEIHDVTFTEFQITKHLTEKYPEEDIRYAILKLAEADYIDAKISNWTTVEEITYKGHEFLESIRDKNVLNKGLEAMKKAGVSSLSMLGVICSEILKSAALKGIGIE